MRGCGSIRLWLGIACAVLAFGAGSAAHAAPDLLMSFDGQSPQPGDLGVPANTALAVGPAHVIEVVLRRYGVYAKDGSPLLPTATLGSLFAAIGPPCSDSSNGSSPGVIHDQIADRWVIWWISAFGATHGACIAVSQTPDPLGAWHRFYFPLSATDFYDDFKLGLWPDGYYAAATRFANQLSYAGESLIAFDRAALLAGVAAPKQEFQIAPGVATNPMLAPADLDGSSPPPAGAPAYFMSRAGASNLRIYRLHVDWTTPASSALTGPTDLATVSYTSVCSTAINCIPQPGTTNRLNGRGDRLMQRLAYRNRGTHESLLANHAVDVAPPRAGVRWYELRVNAGTPSIFQQGTFAPNDGLHRWLGSLAMDRDGNIALGYSVASATLFPSLRFTGRTPADAAGTMLGEGSIVEGTGSQTAFTAWGFHAAMAADPADDCVLWFASEYYATTSSTQWRTRIGALRFPGCVAPAVPVFPALEAR